MASDEALLQLKRRRAAELIHEDADESGSLLYQRNIRKTAAPTAAVAAAEEADDDGEYDEYVPLKVRRAQEEARRRQAAKRARLGGEEDENRGSEVDVSDKVRMGTSESAAEADAPSESGTAAGDSSSGEAGSSASAAPAASQPSFSMGSAARPGMSLLEAARAAAASGVGVVSEDEKRRREEEELLKAVTRASLPALASAKEHALGIRYTEPLKTDWRPPAHLRAMTRERADELRAKWHILVEGPDPPPPIRTFGDMRFPSAILDALAAKGIARPTPIQVQGLPAILSGRDMIGIAFTGSGKTLAFTLPLIMWALQEEMRMPLARGEGPIGIVMAPARELARQHYEGFLHFAAHLKRAGFPELRVMLAVGGEDLKTQMDAAREGVHIVVATPGRLNDHLNKKRINLDLCRYFVLDEGGAFACGRLRVSVCICLCLPAAAHRWLMLFLRRLSLPNPVSPPARPACLHTLPDLSPRLLSLPPHSSLLSSLLPSCPLLFVIALQTACWTWASTRRSRTSSPTSRRSGRRSSSPPPCPRRSRTSPEKPWRSRWWSTWDVQAQPT